MTAPVRIVPARWPEDAEALRRVRHAVFVVEQKVDESLEWDGRDEAARHWLALDEHEIPLGTVRLEADGKIGRMAVLAPRRGTGLGSQLLTAALEAAHARGLERVYLHAQEHALAFYHRHGFVSEGSRFVEADIPHITMTRPSAASYRLALDGAEAVRRVLWVLGDAARQRFVLLTRRMALAPYADPYLARALTALARRERELPVRLFVLEPEQPLPAPLRDLVHDLPSRTGVRAPPEETAVEAVRPLVLADDRHLLRFEDEEEGRGIFHWSDPSAGRAARGVFDTLWNEGATPALFRRMDL